MNCTRTLAAAWAVLALVMGPAAMPQSVKAQPVVAQPTVVTACGHPAYPPWNWASKGRIVGTCAEVAQRAFAHAGLSLRVLDAGPWARCQAMVERGEIDVNICAFDNARRREYSVVIPVPMGRNEAAVFVRRESPLRFERWADLADVRLGMVHGVSLGTEFDQFVRENAKLDQALTEEHNMRKLLAGRVDAVATGRELGVLTLRMLGCTDEVRQLPQSILVGELFIQMSKRSPHVHALGKVQAYLERPDYPTLRERLHRRYTQVYLDEALRENAKCSAFGGTE